MTQSNNMKERRKERLWGCNTNGGGQSYILTFLTLDVIKGKAVFSPIEAVTP